MTDHQMIVQSDPERIERRAKLRVISTSSRDGVGSPEG